jgi:small conductance mechanosensitive channel
MNVLTRLILTTWLLLCLSLGPTDPAEAQNSPDTTQAGSKIEVGADATTDEEIRTRILGLIREIDQFRHVTVEVREGVVTLGGRVLDSTARADLVAIVNRIAGVVAIENQAEVSTNIEERLAPAWNRITDRTRTILTNAPIYIIALSIFLLIAWAGWVITPRLPFWGWLAPNSFIADVYRTIARIAVMLIGLVAALDILNATALLGAVLGAAGVVGLAVGFAVRDTVENFIASILLSLRQPFRPNDFVDINGDHGNVARLTSRATILISPDGNSIRIPNATVYKGRIVNYSRDPNRRFTFELGVDADADLAGALATAADAISRLPFILQDPPVSAWVKEVGDSNVILSFAAWLNQHNTDFLKGRGEAIRAAKSELEATGYGLPEPIYRLRFDADTTTLQMSDSQPEDAANESNPKPRRRNFDGEEVHQSADPERIQNATTNALARERGSSDAVENLLSEARPSE